jgi:hypothetical protein
MSVVSFHPTSKTENTTQSDFEREVASRFGLVPNVFLLRTA